MYCVIQEIELKKINRLGHKKEIISEYMQMSVNGVDCSHYWYRFSEERFERLVKKAYKISIHKSYREAGRVKKKQYVLCTVNYYDIADGFFNLYDYCDRKITSISSELGVSVEGIYTLVEKKTEPLINKVQAEFQQTEEYKAHVENERITTLHAANKVKFNDKYNCDKYDQIYDVFGNLMNKARLDEVKKEFEFQKEYEKKSRGYQREYYSNYKDNYSDTGCGYFNNNSSNHSSEEKEIFKQFYRVLTKKFHPDSNPDQDTSNEMKLLNNLKKEWGL